MIHDAARPNFSIKLLEKLNNESKSNDCVIPGLQVTDSVKQKTFRKIENLKRENIYLIQTPQIFDYKKIYSLQSDLSKKVTDDASLFLSKGKKIKIIKGETSNNKITVKSDIKITNYIRKEVNTKPVITKFFSLKSIWA